MVSGLGFQCTREEGVSRCGLGAKGGELQGEIEDGGQVDGLVVNTGGVGCQVGGAIVGEVTAGVRVTLFGMSECAEEILYDVWARRVCFVCVVGVIDGAVTVLELPIAEMGW